MSESESEQAGAIVVVDPDVASRNNAEDLEDDFDRQVIAMDSMDFDPESSEDVLEASIYIISWNLGFRSGADLLEEIRAHPRLADKKVLIATEKPTRAIVHWAMSLGADGVVTKPYDALEIAARLGESEPSDDGSDERPGEAEEEAA